MENIFGFAGTALVITGYIPQIYHLIKEHCSEGLSIKAYLLWCVSSLLFLVHSFIIGDIVFQFVQLISLISSVIIVIYCRKFKDHYCVYHLNKIKEANQKG
ncbi:MAG: PQ-loop repeat-containing protein [Ignavibacteria bacterium]|nr:PQ-loop repeat-containing protein [Ignavibacteria bacterium]